jgi:hypothetical protein
MEGFSPYEWMNECLTNLFNVKTVSKEFSFDCICLYVEAIIFTDSTFQLPRDYMIVFVPLTLSHAKQLKFCARYLVRNAEWVTL